MQRIMALATLAVLGGLGYLFLQGGGLSQIAVSPGSFAPPGRAHYPPGNWNAPPSTHEPYQKTSTAPRSQRLASAAPSGIAAGPTIRLASFNIQAFGNTKAGKAYVMEALAQIILQFDIVAIQEIRSQNEYLIPNFVDLINRNASGKHYDHVIGPRVGYTSVKEQYAFIFNSERIKVGRQSVYTVGDPDNLLHRKPLVASFNVLGPDPDEAFSFTLVNIHIDPDEVQKEVDALAEVYRVVRRSGEEDDIILVGDFHADDSHLGRLGQVPGIHPLISGVATNTRQTAQYDNIIIHRHSTTEYSGRSGVFDVMRFINKNLEQTLQVSDHLPVWAEFSVYERDFAGRIASRRRGR
ncbi:MAG: endonuclease/exonuclease/phosphatase family protein [Pirellulales bacterium]|nr:endonuclease/exonuclease/phosphatase family protein [Pirellulales bacterium]